MAADLNEIVRYIEKNSDRYLQELFEFLRIPSISTDPERKQDVRKAAEFVADQLRKASMQRVEVFPTDGHPIVYGERVESKNKPTVLIYGHYDVQPVDPVNLWETGPFEPTIRNGELYARGAADDKGQIFIHFKSAEAFVETRQALPVNLKYLIEGEEEVGSSHLDEFIEKNRDLLKADVVVISDTAMFARGIPSICYGLRGLVYFQIDVRGPRQDLHSGTFGGTIANPAFVLAQLLAAMKDEKGRVTLPGFYDDVRNLTERERREFAALPFAEPAYKKELGVAELSGEEGFSPLERLWARPTFEVNGLLSGFTGEGAKTVLPATAMAKVSMRLVPDQQPEKIERLFEAHLQSITPQSVQLKVTRMHGGKPWVASLDHPALLAAANALEKGFGRRPVFQREGGSIPVVATFAERLKIPSVLMGIGLPDENAHAPNEKLDLGNFFGGIRSAAYFLEEFSRRAA
ncbi:MAG: dipeptidase [Acidobacteria bacterium]|nr:dipeptidase [Acidobacteriota bacterium]